VWIVSGAARRRGLVGGRVQQRQQQGELVGGGALPLVDHLRPSLGEHITVGHQHFSQVGDAQTRPPTGRPIWLLQEAALTSAG
jgi:hypothetical protein